MIAGFVFLFVWSVLALAAGTLFGLSIREADRREQPEAPEVYVPREWVA